MPSLTGPLPARAARPGPGPDPTITCHELAAVVSLALARGARSIAVGSGRTPAALAGAEALARAWQACGGQVTDTLTWPESAASWLRQARRFAAAPADLWVMTGPATGWAQMTRRLLRSTPWRPDRTLATAAVGHPATLALVGIHHLHGLAGADANGATWTATDDGTGAATGPGTPR
ncbi:hypothetical protein [Kitasatospora sp. NPDC059327]|uniref:hypothetical protein n=1 Tax=Kitasatospora sp. NPDC059327 TaxID=3346803 RepID=UPI0036B24FAA